jgi:multidrug efflux pump subunit AcrA (membrane-fusion protein)
LFVIEQVEIERAEKTLQTYHAALLNARAELSSALAHEQKPTNSVAAKESAATAALAAKRREMYWREQVDTASSQLSSILQEKPMMKVEQLKFRVQQWRDELKSLTHSDSEHPTSLSEVIAKSKSQIADAETAVTVCERRWNWAKDMVRLFLVCVPRRYQIDISKFFCYRRNNKSQRSLELAKKQKRKWHLLTPSPVEYLMRCGVPASYNLKSQKSPSLHSV